MNPPPGRSALTNRQLAQARVMCDLLDDDALTRIQRSAFEDAALLNLNLAYCRLLAEVVEIAGLAITALPGNASALNEQLTDARLSCGAVTECMQLEERGWLREMLNAARRVDALIPPQPLVSQSAPELIPLRENTDTLPLALWLEQLKALISRLRQLSAEW